MKIWVILVTMPIGSWWRDDNPLVALEEEYGIHYINYNLSWDCYNSCLTSTVLSICVNSGSLSPLDIIQIS